MKKGKVVRNNYSTVVAVLILSIMVGTVVNYNSCDRIEEQASVTKVRKYEKSVSVKYDSVYVSNTVKEVVNEDNRDEIETNNCVEKVEEVDKNLFLEEKIANNEKIVNSTEEKNILKNIGNKNVKVELVEPKVKTVKKTMKKVNASKVVKTKSKGKGMTVSEKNLMYLACIVYAESGSEPYKGKLAVANVVLNRVKSKKYPNSIYGVISQRGQFGPFRNGSLKRAINKYKKGYFHRGNNGYTASLSAAKSALKGNNNIGNRYHFNTRGPARALRIGAHKFW